jgi:4-hydroxy-2-oxoglutarate aldolase
MISLKGIFPPLPTAFDKDQNLACGRLQQNIKDLNNFGLAGFLVLGSNGEMVMLDNNEAEAVMRAARQVIDPPLLMLAGTAAESTRHTIRLTRMAAVTGADAALVLNPSYYKPAMTIDALKDHYFSVAEASSIPVIIYNMPSNTGIDMDAGTILSLAEHPNIIGLKDSSGNMGKLAEILHHCKKGFQVLAGSAGFLLPALSIGATGGILALANIAPYECVEIFRRYIKGDWQTAQQLQQKLISLNHAVTRQWGVAALKAAMDHAGLYGGPPRKPLQQINESQKIILLNLIKKSEIRKLFEV